MSHGAEMDIWVSEDKGERQEGQYNVTFLKGDFIS
jgi:hypothetical protein